MVEEYINSVNKVEYFLRLSNNDKWDLYKNLNDSEQQELLDNLSNQEIKDFLDSLDKDSKREVFKRLSDSQLRAIYKMSSEEEKMDIIQFMETNQMDLNRIVEEARESIQTSISNMALSDEAIEKSNTNISINKENIKEEKQKLKNNKVVLKKLDRERKRNLRNVLRAKKKLTSPLNRIGIISKYRTQKYLDRINDLEQTNQMIDAQKMENEQIKQKIDRLNDVIEKEKANIEEQRVKKEAERHNINLNVSRMGRAETKIKNLSKTEKKILGRKLYNKVVFERDCVIVRKKKEVIKREEEQKNKIVESKSGVEVIEPVKKNNTEVQVNNMLGNASKLQEMGVNFYPPAVQLGGVQGPNLLVNPVMQVSQEQLIVMAYVIGYIHNLKMQQMMQQQMMQQQNLDNGYSRTLSKGFVNLTLLISFIFFGIGLVLFILR